MKPTHALQASTQRQQNVVFLHFGNYKPSAETVKSLDNARWCTTMKIYYTVNEAFESAESLKPTPIACFEYEASGTAKDSDSRSIDYQQSVKLTKNGIRHTYHIKTGGVV